MSETKINYVGPIPELLTTTRAARPWWRRVPIAFLIVVVVPTLLVAAYYMLIASPLYVSEARFVVRQANQPQASSLGFVLQGVGLSASSSDAFAVHEYVLSTDGIRELERQFDLSKMLAPRGVDPLTGWPRAGEGDSDEGLAKALKRFVTVGFDSTTGISTLRVEGFDPRTAQALNLAMLDGGERLVNRMNSRATADAVREAKQSREDARTRLADIQAQLADFRNREQFIDPARTATEGSALVGNLLATIATLRAERAQLASEAPQSPQIPMVDARIAAYESQVETERAKIAGSSTSLASKISTYEDLALRRELADKELAEATASVITAEQDARRQKLYLERIVSPNLPDKPIEPRRFTAILTVFVSMLLIYALGWLIWAGVREHRQV
jgi:capsular polysaccharide transport system permease protein